MTRLESRARRAVAYLCLLQSEGGDDGANGRVGYVSGVFGRVVVPGGHVGGTGVVAYVLAEQTADPFEPLRS